MSQTQTDIPKQINPDSQLRAEGSDLTPASNGAIASQEAFDTFADINDTFVPDVVKKQIGVDRAKLQSVGTRVGDSIRRGGVAVSHLVERVDPFSSADLKYSEDAIEKKRKETIRGHLI